jgi:RNA polymerase sigma-70 factor (ECF subfamily)
MHDETLLIKKVQEGDIDAFKEIIILYKKPMYNLCFRMLNSREEAEDATQEAFIKIYRGINTYNAKYKLSSWVFKIASNVCIDAIRKRKTYTVSIDDYEIPDKYTPEENYIDSEMKRDVNAAVESLPQIYKEVIIYYHFMNLSYKEISDILDMPMTKVKNRLYRARLILKQKLHSTILNERDDTDELRRDIRANDGIS